MAYTISDADRALIISRVAEGKLKHFALTADGNGRWATTQGLERAVGHEEGIRSFVACLKVLRELGVPFFSIHAFSPENWGRNAAEVNYIIDLVQRSLTYLEPSFMREQVRFTWAGTERNLPDSVVDFFKGLADRTSGNTGITLQFCFNYGGRQEIYECRSQFNDDSIDWNSPASRFGYNPEIPPVDFYVRTGGELRISNFLIWQLAHAELYFTDVPWPAFRDAELLESLVEFCKRDRSFGRVPTTRASTTPSI